MHSTDTRNKCQIKKPATLIAGFFHLLGINITYNKKSYGKGVESYAVLSCHSEEPERSGGRRENPECSSALNEVKGLLAQK